jgi:hypothetical protein
LVIGPVVPISPGDPYKPFNVKGNRVVLKNDIFRILNDINGEEGKDQPGRIYKIKPNNQLRTGG